MQVINKGLISHPLNWVTIFLMVLIASIAGHKFLELTGNDPATQS